MIHRRAPSLRPTHVRSAFTLVELLVVIGIIAILIAILLPALGKAKQQANVTACLSNQKQLLTALLMYVNDNKGTFPGGPGIAKYGGDSAPRLYRALATWDSAARNPYSCNQDEASGPTFLAKYVGKSKRIPGCPANPDSVKDTGFDASTNRSNYWYPMSLVYKPEELYTGNINYDLTFQTPQKITAVKFPAQKAAIIDYKTYHDKIVYQVDKVPPELGIAEKDNKRVVVVGFVDGHAERRNVGEMFDRDINRTGRGSDSPATAGVRGRDFK